MPLGDGGTTGILFLRPLEKLAGAGCWGRSRQGLNPSLRGCTSVQQPAVWAAVAGPLVIVRPGSSGHVPAQRREALFRNSVKNIKQDKRWNNTRG